MRNGNNVSGAAPAPVEIIGRHGAEKGFVFMWMLFSVTLAGIMLAGAGQVWKHQAQREKEKELIQIGEQFRHAIISYYSDEAAGTKQYPESLKDLLEDKRSAKTERHLRKIFTDPMTRTTDWGLVPEPVPEGTSTLGASKGIIGVYSLSKEIPVKVENFPSYYETFKEAVTYQDWQFAFLQEGDGTSTQQKTQSDSPSSESGSPFSSQSSSQSGSGSSPFSSQSSSESSSQSSSSPSSGSGQNPFGGP